MQGSSPIVVSDPLRWVVESADDMRNVECREIGALPGPCSPERIIWHPARVKPTPFVGTQRPEVIDGSQLTGGDGLFGECNGRRPNVSEVVHCLVAQQLPSSHGLRRDGPQWPDE